MAIATRRMSDSSIVTLTTEYGKIPKEGTFGTIYDVEGNPELIAKMIKWHPDHQGSGKLTQGDYYSRLLTLIQRLHPISHYRDGGVRFTSPIDLLYSPDDNTFVGYLMHKAQGQSWEKVLYGGISKSIALDQKLAAIASLIKAVDLLHSKGFSVGDWNPLNFWVDPNHSYRCTLLDTETFGFTRGGVSFPPPYHPENLAPETLTGKEIKATDWRARDIFCMAAMIYQTLTGNHPFDRRDDPDFPDVGSQAEAIKTGMNMALLDFEFQKNNQNEWKHSKSISLQREPLTFWMFPRPLRNVLGKTLIDGFGAPEKRPSSEEWVSAICELCKTKLVRCDQGHTHFRNLTVCPECFPVSFFSS